MRTIARVVIVVLVLCMAGSLFAETAHARRGGHGGHGPRVGIGFWVGPGWWPYYYPSYYYPYYPPDPPVIIQQQPDIYAQPQPQPQEQPLYWYYCKESQGYYPYIKECPSGWMKVVPTPPAPENAE